MTATRRDEDNEAYRYASKDLFRTGGNLEAARAAYDGEGARGAFEVELPC